MTERPALVIAGPSGGGKTTVVDELLKLSGDFLFLRSATTRPPRGDHDDEYVYLSEEEFLAREQMGGMLESMTYGDYRYGTPKSEFDRAASEGKTPLLILDLVGVGSLRAKAVPMMAAYVYSSPDRVEERLYARLLGKEQTADGFFAFLARKNRNLADYASLPEKTDLFDLFLENGEGDPHATAEALLSAYRGFLAGTPPEKNAAAADALAAYAKEKENYTKEMG